MSVCMSVCLCELKIYITTEPIGLLFSANMPLFLEGGGNPTAPRDEAPVRKKSPTIFFLISLTEVEYPGFDFKKGGGLPITS